MRKRDLRGFALLALAIAIGTSFAMWRRPGAPPAEPLVFSSTGPLTIAATGDTLISRAVAGPGSDAAFDAIVDVVRGATLAITNLEMNLLAEPNAMRARGSPEPRWTFGSAREAEALAALGFDVVGQANNHAADYGPDGMADTSAILKASGLVPAGTGRDLGHAREAVMVGSGSRRIAVLAVAISASPESVATSARRGVNGRPGVNPLRYIADVTVDAKTYETLRRLAPALQGGSETAGDRFTLLGTSIKKGTETSVTLVPDARDLEGILAEVARARAAAEIVVLSVHSHEPSNDSDEPAEIVRRLAHQAIDAGVQLVVGHGPHRLRGVEVYMGGAILYSVGNFLYVPEEGRRPPNDPYDAGLDMYSLAMGMASRPPTVRGAGADGRAFSEGVVAVATFDGGALRSLALHPVDLGGDPPTARHGVPRRPAPARAVAILDRLARLSQPYDTTVRIESGVGIVDLE